MVFWREREESGEEDSRFKIQDLRGKRQEKRKMSEEDGSASFSLSFRTSSALRPEATATFKMIRPFALHSLSGETPQPRSR